MMNSDHKKFFSIDETLRKYSVFDKLLLAIDIPKYIFNNQINVFGVTLELRMFFLYEKRCQQYVNHHYYI